MNFKDIIKEDCDENSENNDHDDDPDYNLVMRVSAKGQLISGCLFDFLEFSKKKNEKFVPESRVVKS